jgi:hypothetical protein
MQGKLIHHLTTFHQQRLPLLIIENLRHFIARSNVTWDTICP